MTFASRSFLRQPHNPSRLHGECGSAANRPTRAMKTLPGKPYPLGATWDGAGVNFALASENATGVEICLFGGDDGNATASAHRGARADRLRMARLFSRHPPRTALWISGCMDPTSRPTAIDSIPPSCCWIPTPRRSIARSIGTMRCSATRSEARSRTCKRMIATAHRSRQRAWSPNRGSIGKAIGGCRFHGKTPSSMSFTPRA